VDQKSFTKQTEKTALGKATFPFALGQACAPRPLLEGLSDLEVQLKTGVHPVPIKHILAMGEILGNSFNHRNMETIPKSDFPQILPDLQLHLFLQKKKKKKNHKN
jgi:hypothetical protein